MRRSRFIHQNHKPYSSNASYWCWSVKKRLFFVSEQTRSRVIAAIFFFLHIQRKDWQIETTVKGRTDSCWQLAACIYRLVKWKGPSVNGSIVRAPCCSSAFDSLKDGNKQQAYQIRSSLQEKKNTYVFGCTIVVSLFLFILSGFVAIATCCCCIFLLLLSVCLLCQQQREWILHEE